MNILGQAESFKTMNWPGPTRHVSTQPDLTRSDSTQPDQDDFDGLFLGKYKI